MAYDIPILVIAFNRPEVTRETFEYIRAVKPTKLYLAVDGARNDRIGESELVSEVKQIFDCIDWPCEVHRKYNAANLGAEVTVSSAISWALTGEEYVIVLEDDIIASKAFLFFAREMLHRYKDNPVVYMVSGGNYTPYNLKSDYMFCYSGHTGCGWATWRRAWNHFSLSCNFDISKEELYECFVDAHISSYRYKQIKKISRINGSERTWDVCWSYTRLKNKGLSIVPRVNLTSNIGVYGLHDNGRTRMHYLPYDVDFIATIHPERVAPNHFYDRYHFYKYLYRPLWRRIINKVRSFFRF